MGDGDPAGGAPVAFFDVDQTLITVNSMVSFLRYRLAAAGEPESAYQDALASLRRLVIAGAPRDRVARCYYALMRGCEVATVTALGCSWFAAERRRGRLFARHVTAAWRRHQRAGHGTVLVSGSLPACVEPIGRFLRADRIACAELAARDGRYTGEVVRTMLGEDKADVVRRVAAERDVPLAECYAYGDHESDGPMLATVGRPVIVGDDPVLAGYAAGWRAASLPAAAP